MVLLLAGAPAEAGAVLAPEVYSGHVDMFQRLLARTSGPLLPSEYITITPCSDRLCKGTLNSLLPFPQLQQQLPTCCHASKSSFVESASSIGHV